MFARARENARRSSCQSNLKQIGLGLLQYIGDSDDVMPFAYHGNSPQGDQGGPTTQFTGFVWNDMIYPYVKSEQIFTCPSFSQFTGIFAVKPYTYVNPPGDPAQPGQRGWYAKTYGTYALNVACGTKAISYPNDSVDSSHDNGDTLVRSSKLAVPSTTVWVVETRGGGHHNGQKQYSNAITWRDDAVSGPTVVIADTYGPSMDYPVSYRTMGESTDQTYYSTFELAERHLETTNVLWADGHVKAVKLEKLAPTHVVNYGGTNNNVHYLFTAADD